MSEQSNNEADRVYAVGLIIVGLVGLLGVVALFFILLADVRSSRECASICSGSDYEMKDSVCYCANYWLPAEQPGVD